MLRVFLKRSERLLLLKDMLFFDRLHFSNITKTRIGLCLILSFSLAVAGFGQDPLAIVEKFLEVSTYNKIASLDDITSLYLESTVFYDHTAYEGRINFQPPSSKFQKVYYQFPADQRTELYGDSSCAVLLITLLIHQNRHVIFFPNIDAMEAPWDERMFITLECLKLRKAVKNPASLRWLGETTDPEGNTCSKIGVTIDKFQYEYFFNRDTFLLESIHSLDPEYILKFFDYKEINGYLVPTLAINYNKGQIYSSSKLHKLKFNEVFKAKIFTTLEK